MIGQCMPSGPPAEAATPSAIHTASVNGESTTPVPEQGDTLVPANQVSPTVKPPQKESNGGPWESAGCKDAEANNNNNNNYGGGNNEQSSTDLQQSSASIFYALLSSAVLSRPKKPLGLEAGPLKIGRSCLLVAYVIIVLIAGPFIINFNAVYRIHQTNSSYNWLCPATRLAGDQYGSVKLVAGDGAVEANGYGPTESGPVAMVTKTAVEDARRRRLLVRKMALPAEPENTQVTVVSEASTASRYQDHFGSFDDDLEGIQIGLVGSKTCGDQRRAIYNLIPIGMTSLFFFSVAGGMVADFMSPKVAAVAGLLFLIAGWALVAVSTQDGPYLQLATMFLGAGSDPLFIALLSIRCLFPQHRATVICVLYSARYVAYVFPLVAVSQLSIKLSAVAWTYCILLSICVLACLIIVPNSPFKYSVEPVAPLSAQVNAPCSADSSNLCGECGGVNRNAVTSNGDGAGATPKSLCRRLVELLGFRGAAPSPPLYPQSSLNLQSTIAPLDRPKPVSTLPRGSKAEQIQQFWTGGDTLVQGCRAPSFSTASRSSGGSKTSPYSFSSTLSTDSCSNSCASGYSVSNKFRASRALPLAGSSCRNARSFMSASSERIRSMTSVYDQGELMTALRATEHPPGREPQEHPTGLVLIASAKSSDDPLEVVPEKTPLNLDRINAAFFLPMLPLAASCLLCCMFFSLTSARQFQQHNHRAALLFHRILTPLSFIPAVLLGYICDTTTPILALTVTVVSLFAQFAALFVIPAMAYLAVFTNLLTAAFVFAQVFCYVTICFPQRLFATLSGFALSLCGLVSLIVTPMYDFASFENRFEPMNALCLGLLSLDFALAYYLNAQYKRAIRSVPVSPLPPTMSVSRQSEPV